MVGKRTLESQDSEAVWTFLTNHGHVLLCIAKEPEVRMREVANRVGITERAVQRIVADLEGAGYIVRSRHGRRNRYEIRESLPLRHPVERHVRLSSLLTLVHGEREAVVVGKEVNASYMGSRITATRTGAPAADRRKPSLPRGKRTI